MRLNQIKSEKSKKVRIFRMKGANNAPKVYIHPTPLGNTLHDDIHTTYQKKLMFGSR